MPFELRALPYPENALSPVISPETIEYHYGKHHQTYVDNLNRMTADSDLGAKSLEEVVRSAEGGVFNNAAQVWNHDFYWESMTPESGTKPSAELAAAIESRYGSADELKKAFIASATGNFGSGWTWLVRKADGGLDVVNTSNAATPITGADSPLLVVDVWEHAYYIDYRNARPRYLEAWWDLVNWSAVSQRLAG